MQLMMYLGNDLIDSIPVNFYQLSQPGYLGKFKRVLKDKHAAVIRESPIHPEFLVVDLAPATNSKQDRY
ncbi:MAG: hypothetical protein ACTHOF_01135 [Flavisolibacter sp.]